MKKEEFCECLWRHQGPFTVQSINFLTAELATPHHVWDALPALMAAGEGPVLVWDSKPACIMTVHAADLTGAEAEEYAPGHETSNTGPAKRGGRRNT